MPCFRLYKWDDHGVERDLSGYVNYVMLRVDGEPGNQPVGGEKAEPGAPARLDQNA